MTIEEAREYWSMRLERAECYSDDHWDAEERHAQQILKNEIMVIPSFGVINERPYFGYPVIAIAFGWLCFRAKIEFGVRVVRF